MEIHDLAKVQEFYGWQVGHGVFENYGGRTNRETVLLLLAPYLSSGVRVLDLGCGNGTVAEAILNYTRSRSITPLSYTTVEVCPELMSEFRQKNLSATLLEQDATDLSGFADADFDVALCLFLLQDLRRLDTIELLRCLRRVLRADGKLLIALTVHPTISRSLGEDYRPKAFPGEVKGKFTYLWGEPQFEAELHQLQYEIKTRYQDLTDAGLWESYWLFRTT